MAFNSFFSSRAILSHFLHKIQLKPSGTGSRMMAPQWLPISTSTRSITPLCSWLCPNVSHPNCHLIPHTVSAPCQTRASEEASASCCPSHPSSPYVSRNEWKWAADVFQERQRSCKSPWITKAGEVLCCGRVNAVAAASERRGREGESHVDGRQETGNKQKNGWLSALVKEVIGSEGDTRVMRWYCGRRRQKTRGGGNRTAELWREGTLCATLAARQLLLSSENTTFKEDGADLSQRLLAEMCLASKARF